VFHVLCDGTIQYEAARSIASLAQLRQGVDRFADWQLLFYGNVKFWFQEARPVGEDLADHHARSARRARSRTSVAIQYSRN